MDVQRDPGANRTSLVQGMVILVVLLIAAALAITGYLSSGRVSNDRSSSSHLHSLCAAEADFRANDRDWNHVSDFWTGDVKSLYTLTSAAVRGAHGGTQDPPIKLISLSLAAADADGTLVEAGGENTALGSYTVPSAYQGYWYAALTLDLDSPGAPESTYKLDTGGTPPMGSCHNLTKFGFVSFPDSESAGPYGYLVNENNRIFKRATMGAVRTDRSVPPGLNGFREEYRNWPKQSDLKLGWGPHD